MKLDTFTNVFAVYDEWLLIDGRNKHNSHSINRFNHFHEEIIT